MARNYKSAGFTSLLVLAAVGAVVWYFWPKSQINVTTGLPLTNTNPFDKIKSVLQTVEKQFQAGMVWASTEGLPLTNTNPFGNNSLPEVTITGSGS